MSDTFKMDDCACTEVIERIKEESDAISKYNNMLQCLTCRLTEVTGDTRARIVKAMEVITSIRNEEVVHIGELKTLLFILNDNYGKLMEKGKDEVTEKSAVSSTTEAYHTSFNSSYR